MSMFAVRYLDKILPAMGLFATQEALAQWIQDNDPERASFYEAVPMHINS